MNHSKAILTASNLSVGYSTKKETKTVLEQLNLELIPGELTCLLGPNGAGKSTLMRSLAGIQKPLGGAIEINGTDLADLTSKDMAQKLSLVLTERATPGNLTAYALVSLGRYPYSSWMGTLKAEDKSRIQWAMEVTRTTEFSNTHIGELSDGERQKVMIARALAQDTAMIFLDEPTAHLDLPNRIDIFHLLKELAVESKKAILLSSHEMDMALANATRMWLVNSNRTIISGIPEDLVITGQLEKSFARDSVKFDYQDGNFKREVLKTGLTLFVDGPELLGKWTRRALERQGYVLVSQNEAERIIRVKGDMKHAEWHVDDEKTTYKTLEQLLNALKK